MKVTILAYFIVYAAVMFLYLFSWKLNYKLAYFLQLSPLAIVTNRKYTKNYNFGTVVLEK
jgi:hypothetical protein